MELNNNTIKKILFIITFAILLCTLCLHCGAVWQGILFVWGVCFPFILGGGLAFVVNIPMSFLERKIFAKTKISERLSRVCSLILTLVIIDAIFAIVIVVVVPQLTVTIESVGVTMSTSLPKVQSWLESIFAENKEVVQYISSIEMDWGKWLGYIKDFALNGAGNVLSYTVSATAKVVNFVVTFFIAFVFSIYILLQKEKLANQGIKVLKAFCKEKVVDRICYICALSHSTFSKFFTGQCIEALILGAMFLIAMMLFRLPYALLVGVLIAVTALIPIVGAFVGCFIGAFLILMVNPMQALIFVILFLVLQQIEGNLIYPHVVGNSVGLPSMWVLFAVTVGGSLFGIAGMLLFIPALSVVYSLFRDWVNEKNKKM